MTLTAEPIPVPFRTDEAGTIRIGKSRVTLDVVIRDGNGRPNRTHLGAQNGPTSVPGFIGRERPAATLLLFRASLLVTFALAG